MAEVQDIYGNQITGPLGPVSFYQSRGKTIMRRKPGKRTSRSTDKQLKNQVRFKNMRQFCSKFKERVIPRIWNGVAVTSSGYHLFMKTNSPAFDKDGLLADPSKVVLSIGKLTVPQGMQARRTLSGGNTISIKWDKEPELSGPTLKDQLMVVSSGEGKYSEIIPTGLIRLNLNGTFELPELAVAATCIYLFFESMDQRYYSPSVCLAI